MASYGYSTPYHGMAGGALPQGYMEAATAPGRLLGQGIASLGQNIQAGINQYMKNRDEENYLNAKIDAGLAQYAQAAAQSGGTMPNGDAANVEQAAKIIGEKNAKKLFEGNASRSEKLSIAHALETYGQTQLQALQRKQMEEAINSAKLQTKLLEDEATRRKSIADSLAGAFQFAGGLPQTTTVSETSQVRTPPSIAEEQAANYYMGRAAGAAKQMAEESNRLFKVADQPYIEPAPGRAAFDLFGVKVPTTAERNQALKEQAAQLYSQSQVLSKASGQKLQPGPGSTIEQVTQKTIPVPYEDLRSQVVSYLQKSKAPAEVYGALESIMATTGAQRPMQVSQQVLPGGAQVIRADGKIEVIPPPKPIEGKPLTEGQGKAVQFATGMSFNNDTVNKVIESGYIPGEITEFGATPTRFWSENRRIYTSARDAWIENFLRDRSGANTPPEEYATAINQYFPLPGDSQKEIQRKAQMRKNAYNATKAKVGEHADYYMGQVLNQQAETPSGPKATESARIKALFNAKKITKEEAIKQLQALK